MGPRILLLLGVFGGLTGCFATSAASKRVALAPSPGSPPQLRGSAGLGLAARIAPTAPRAGGSGAGVAVPSLQPEVNGVFKFAERIYASFNLLFIPGTNTQAALPDAPQVSADLSGAGMVGFGYDFQVVKEGGIQAAGEFGLSSISVTSTVRGAPVALTNFLLPMGRLSVAPYFERGALRLFAAGTIGSDVWSEPDGIATSCTGCIGSTDSGKTEISAMGMVGGGARYRPHPMVSLALEFWVPVTTAGVRHSPQVNLAVQVGNFDFSPSQRPPAEPVPEERQHPPPEGFQPLVPPPFPGSPTVAPRLPPPVQL